ncbi:hypothetical protein pEaSNUABM56_00270 [Erwinia phage pEa_SNUABM_56]|uniref:Uncharacterized protein n=1 Tax=Erwinia phage pEp_SNUABM_01 TaxID=2601643 RepID=A0A5J6DBV8_9CAUD|nr:hypothetical protein HWC63_gp133 [Erwinia phage pEp_SNUABM_01]QEQ95045.1 hypothetical protein pEpSNUABM01_219 [Erwinia phage pEp_SNUABM_01]UYL84973.1 hypothetical protein pEaSNUABM55_00200 [Erwinia phage pEa_SNUABM_55]UYL85290.1 hypothetical protein pEaSNUABM56_00270 [Erwinia phage pEa_SNUABM_56]
MTTITIRKKEIDQHNVLILEAVQIDHESFFHIHGLKDARPIDHRVHFEDTAWPCLRAQELYDHYDKIVK